MPEDYEFKAGRLACSSAPPHRVPLLALWSGMRGSGALYNLLRRMSRGDRRFRV